MAKFLKPLAIVASLLIIISCSNEELNEESVTPDSVSKVSPDYSTRLNATTVQAESYDAQSGIQTVGGWKVGYVNNNDWIRFDDFDYSGANSVSVQASSKTGGGTIEFRAGSPTGGDLLGTVSVSNTGNWNTMQTFTGSIDDDSNNSDLYLVFKGGSGYLLDIDSFQFSGSSSGGGSGSGSGTNLALNGTAEQSSTSHGGVPSRAIDGDTNGNWSNGSVTHTANTYQPWWQVRLANDTNIEQVVIWNRVNCCIDRLSNFDVFIYNQAGTQVFKTTIVDTPTPSVTINTGGVNGNRVRVKLKGTNPLSLAEVQVYGEAGDNGGGGSGGGGSSGDTPGGILGLTNNDWKLNGFTASPSASATYYDDVMDQVNGNIATWTNDNYFFENNGWAYFKCYRGLGSSQNSNNPRVELREMNGGNLESWNGDNGSHIMSFTVRVDQLPNGWNEGNNAERTTGTVCFAQIHGPSGTNSQGVEVDDTIRVQFEGTRGQTSGAVKLKISGYITEEVLGGSQTFTGYSLDTSYNMQLRFIDDVVSLVVNGTVVFSQEMDTAGNGSYFKLGSYLQSVQDGSFDGSFGLVGFKNLSISGH